MSRILPIITVLLIVSFAADTVASSQRRKRRPRREPPTIGCGGPVCIGITADRVSVKAGEFVALMANASDPDGDVLIYAWSTTGGQIAGKGASVLLDTTGITEPTTFTVTATIDDGYQHVVNCTAVVISVEPASKP
jgi:hypothetical protein